MRASWRSRLLSLLLVIGGCQKSEPARPQTQPAPPEAEVAQKESNPTASFRNIQLSVHHQAANKAEDNLSEEQLFTLVQEAATAANFTVDPKGHQTEVSVAYGTLSEGEPDPEAERGTIAWSVGIHLRLVDAEGLGESMEGFGRGEIPFVRAAIPAMPLAMAEVAGQGLKRAFRDLSMQLQYREAKPEEAAQGLHSPIPEEQWAALRRIGELQAKDYREPILELIETAEPTTLVIALGVLRRLRDVRSLAPLARFASTAEPETAILVGSALVSIGGNAARPHLQAMAEEHPEPRVRDAVRELLQQLE